MCACCVRPWTRRIDGHVGSGLLGYVHADGVSFSVFLSVCLSRYRTCVASTRRRNIWCRAFTCIRGVRVRIERAMATCCMAGVRQQQMARAACSPPRSDVARAKIMCIVAHMNRSRFAYVTTVQILSGLSVREWISAASSLGDMRPEFGAAFMHSIYPKIMPAPCPISMSSGTTHEQFWFAS